MKIPKKKKRKREFLNSLNVLKYHFKKLFELKEEVNLNTKSVCQDKLAPRHILIKLLGFKSKDNNSLDRQKYQHSYKGWK